MTEFNRSRRNFLSANFSEQKPQFTSTDKAVERIGEGVALAAVVGLAYVGSRDRLLTHSVHSESLLKDSPDFNDSIASIEGLKPIFSDVNTSVSLLSSAWKDAYYKSRIKYVQQSPKQECTGTGDDRRCTMVPQPPKREVEYYWDEPYTLGQIGVSHGSIGSWNYFLNRNRDSTEHLFGEANESFDFSSEGKKLYYKDHQADSKSQSWLSVPLYALVGSSFVFYEEVLKKMEAQGLITESPVLEDKFIKRRTVLKLAAVAPLAYKVREAQLLFAENNKGKLNEVKEYVGEVVRNLDSPPDVHFQQFFGTDVLTMRQTIKDLSDKTAYANQIFDDPLNPNVKTMLKQVAWDAAKSLASFDQFFSFDEDTGSYLISTDLFNITRSIVATQRIINYTQEQSSRIYTRHILNALAMALGLTAVGIIGESIFNLTDKG